MFATRLRLHGELRRVRAPKRMSAEAGNWGMTHATPRHKNKNPGAIAGVFYADATTTERRRYTRNEKRRRSVRLQLSVFAEHSAALVADAPAVSGKRCPAAQQVGPSHATRMIAHPCRSRLAWRKLGKIDGFRGRAGKREQRTDQQACEYHWLHPQSSLAVFGKGSG
jgi:hypothetical protein